MLIGKTRTNQPVEGYQDAPVFEGEFEEKEGVVSLDMEDKDLDYIFEHKPMVIGIRVPDEDEEGKFQVIYFALAVDRKDTDDSIMYQLVMTDKDKKTITQLSLSFINDGDDIKVLYEEEELKALPEVTSADAGKLLGVVYDGEVADIELVDPDEYTRLYKHNLHLTTDDDDDIYLELINNIPSELNTKQKVMSAMRTDLISASNYRHIVVIGYFNTTPIYLSVDNSETNIIRGNSISGMTATSYPPITFADVVTAL